MGLPTKAAWTADTNVQCTSYDALCDMSFGFGEPSTMLPSSGPMCICPGDVTCPRNSSDQSQAMTLELITSGQKITLRLSYCSKKSYPDRKCKPDEITMRMRGPLDSPILLTVADAPNCTCPEPLVLHSSKPDGVFIVQEYTCGKPMCNINRSDPPVCERIRSDVISGRYVTSTEVQCQCPLGFSCSGFKLSGLPGRKSLPEEITCEAAYY
ncbi:hypothetical protein DPMN_150835 [Dreissena polymorpha]|uniref:Uncharacterized protein n=2 Tax=Dreissena polymorpha TaxID=45954 RepID=A0A9D4FE50_DREPO|nr:hypothetical protein DPMN_150835 [Dreissena polymorpha]